MIVFSILNLYLLALSTHKHVKCYPAMTKMKGRMCGGGVRLRVYRVHFVHGFTSWGLVFSGIRMG